MLSLSKRTYPDLKLIIIPSWGKLLGYPTLGKYKNQKITNISSDPVIFLSNYESSITEINETRHYLFGIGFYYTKFQIGDEKYIIDYRHLTGLCLSDFVHQYMLESEDISLINNRDFILKESIYKFPLEFSTNLPTNQKSFVKGILTREIFIPYKEILTKFTELLQNDPYFQFNSSHHQLLLATHDYYNTFYISNKSSPEHQKAYLQSTAGITHLATGADFILQKQFNPEELELIHSQILELESSFRKKEYIPTDPLSFFEAAAQEIRTSFSQSKIEASAPNTASILTRADLKPGIFVTSPEYSDSIPWASDHPRKTLESWGITQMAHTIRPTALTESKVEKTSESLKNYRRGPTQNTVNFELKINQKPRVASRSLPRMPEDTVKAILLFLQQIITEDYEASQIGDAFGIARDRIRKLAFHTDYIWELSKISNRFQKEEPEIGLNSKEKESVLLKVNEWIEIIETEERLERERIEKERLRLEQLERERLEQERLKREKEEFERLEKLRIAKEQEEKERRERKLKEREASELLKRKKPQLKELKIQKSPELHLSTIQKTQEELLSPNSQTPLTSPKAIKQEGPSFTLSKSQIVGEFHAVLNQIDLLNQKLNIIRDQIPQSRAAKRQLRKDQKMIKKKIKVLSKQLRKMKKKK